MVTIKAVRAMRDLELKDHHSGQIFHLTEGGRYELHMGDAHLQTEPERFYPCEVHAVGSAATIGTMDQRDAGSLIADGSLQ